MEQNKESTSEKTIGRNEPCPCRSGKKYKRCCGVDAAPKMTTPRALAPSGPAAPGGMTPDMLNQMDPAVMMKLSQSLQRLPKGQMQRLQSLVQRAMSGKDVSRESANWWPRPPLRVKSVRTRPRSCSVLRATRVRPGLAGYSRGFGKRSKISRLNAQLPSSPENYLSYRRGRPKKQVRWTAHNCLQKFRRLRKN